MSTNKDTLRGTWTVQCWFHDWKGERRKKTKRGFLTKAKAQEWERNFLAQCNGAPTMTFGDFCSLYESDMRPRLKRNTWNTKEHIIRKKILPYFENRPLNEISGSDILAWENSLMAATTSVGLPYSETYLRTVTNQMSAVLNHAVRYYNLPVNPLLKVGKIGSKQTQEMQYWTKAEYLIFSRAMMDKPLSFIAFELLYWTGLRMGELLALTPSDFDFEKQLLSITKSYQRIECEDVITTPKTPKSVRLIVMPEFLSDEVHDYLALIPALDADDRIFPITKSGLHHEMNRGTKETGVKRIRIHDLRHSHVSLLIEMGYSALAIAERLGHGSIEVTMGYAHLFPNKQNDIARSLNQERGDALCPGVAMTK